MAGRMAHGQPELLMAASCILHVHEPVCQPPGCFKPAGMYCQTDCARRMLAVPVRCVFTAAGMHSAHRAMLLLAPSSTQGAPGASRSCVWGADAPTFYCKRWLLRELLKTVSRVVMIDLQRLRPRWWCHERAQRKHSWVMPTRTRSVHSRCQSSKDICCVTVNRMIHPA
jgi:hypothetical protein